MVDAPAVRRRLRRLDEILQQLRALAGQGRAAFHRDRIAQAAAERLLQLAIQIVLDVGAHVLSDRGIVDWDEYRQVPSRLARIGVISPGLADRLARAAGQRNILVHMYLDVDPDLVFDVLEGDLDVFQEFADAIASLLDDGGDTANP